MQKLLLFFLVLIGVWLLRRWWQRQGDEASSQQKAAPQAAAPETMRECAHCGLLVPESEGVKTAGRFFCSAEHARAAERSS